MITPPFIEMAGLMATGKTTLATLLGKRLEWPVMREEADDNVILALFYKDPKKWAFALENYLITRRLHELLRFINSEKPFVSDRSIGEDFHIFTKALGKSGTLSEGESLAITETFYRIQKVTPKPKVVVYLDCPTDELMIRIKERNREMEKTITPDYLELLRGFYNDWLSIGHPWKVYKIDSSKIDFRKEMVLRKVSEEVNALLPELALV